ncbi:MAG: zinc ribbon domain-containing protein [Cystobacterineae bacterium]|nr:zinc ribbon domain-containing protein [Cystobacterineae bacterium]
MPVYEYLCEACGVHVDLLQKIDAPAPECCTSCGAPNTLKKRISMSAFHLKGGGWHSELYASPSKTQGEAPASTATHGAASGAKNPETKNPAPASPCANCPAASSPACASTQKP